jgi:hypothetical protein
MRAKEKNFIMNKETFPQEDIKPQMGMYLTTQLKNTLSKPGVVAYA